MPQPVHAFIPSRSRARPRRSTRPRTDALSSGSRAGPGSSRSVSISRIRSRRCARRGRSCVACSPATTRASRVAGSRCRRGSGFDSRSCATRCRSSSARGRRDSRPSPARKRSELKVGGSANPDVVPVMRERIGEPRRRDRARRGDGRRRGRRPRPAHCAPRGRDVPRRRRGARPDRRGRPRAHRTGPRARRRRRSTTRAGSLIPDDLLDRFCLRRDARTRLQSTPKRSSTRAPGASTSARRTELPSGEASSCSAPSVLPRLRRRRAV